MPQYTDFFEDDDEIIDFSSPPQEAKPFSSPKPLDAEPADAPQIELECKDGKLKVSRKLAMAGSTVIRTALEEDKEAKSYDLPDYDMALAVWLLDVWRGRPRVPKWSVFGACVRLVSQLDVPFVHPSWVKFIPAGSFHRTWAGVDLFLVTCLLPHRLAELGMSEIASLLAIDQEEDAAPLAKPVVANTSAMNQHIHIATTRIECERHDSKDDVEEDSD